MINSLEINRWLELSTKLVAFQICGQRLFPVYSADGSIAATYAAYVAKDEESFPEEECFGIEPGISANGKFYRMIFSGNRRRTYENVAALLRAAEEALG